MGSGAHVTAAGIWTNASDRNLKENFQSVDGREVLVRLSGLPITTWNGKAEDASIRHMGPMAQDLYAAFGLGDSEKSIGTVDADGVALAAIQGLYEMVKEKDAQIAAQRDEISALGARLERIESMLVRSGSAPEGGTR